MAMSVLRTCLILTVLFTTEFMIMWCLLHDKIPAYAQKSFFGLIILLTLSLPFCIIPSAAPYAITLLISSLFFAMFDIIINSNNVTYFIRTKTERTIFLVMMVLFLIVFIISGICILVTCMNM